MENKVNDNIKTFSLVVIACSLFSMTVLKVLEYIDNRNENGKENASEISPASNASQFAGKHEITPLPEVKIDSTMPKTTMSMDPESYDMGNMKAGDTASYDVTITNTGLKPLKIFDARGTCGCTKPRWTQEPILPGKKGKVHITFNSTGKQGHQNKTVTIQTNAMPNPQTVAFTAMVMEKK